MGYINKKTRNLIDRMKVECVLPDDWNNFVYEQEKYHNLILKDKNMYYCTNCQQTYTYLNNGPKVKTTTVCPHCKNKYWVRSSKLKHWTKKDDLILLDKIDGELIVRIFEMRTDFNWEKQEMEHSVVEYARKIVDDDYRELRNERVSISVMRGPFVLHHIQDEGKWRAYDGYYYESIPQGYIYSNNLKKILKGTIYERSRLWKLVKHYKNDYLNIQSLLSEAKYESFESLVEMKLYNLALSAREFHCKGSFKKIFGVDKTYYQFMKKYDIGYEELELLRMYQTKDIRRLRFIRRYMYVIKEIKEYTSIDNFINYFRKHHLRDAFLYRDYLNFAKELGLNLKNKKYLFPDKLKRMHDKYEKQLKQIREEETMKNIEKRAKELAKYIFKDKDFIIFPADSINAMIDESKQQNNCVRTYTERYSKGECDIYFMRRVDNPNISLVTVEVKDNKIIQKRTKNNAMTNKKQNAFLNMWQKKVLERKAA